jgi:hypothetical protein
MTPYDVAATLRAEFLTADLFVNAWTLTLLGGSGRPRHNDSGQHRSGRQGS